MHKEKKLCTIEEIKAISDPYRMKILETFKLFNRPATVKEVADALGEVPAKIHYHVKKLEKYEIIKLVYTKEIKGIVAKYYEPTASRFQIGSGDVSDSLKKIYKNEICKIVNDRFESNKIKFIESLDKSFKNKKEEDNTNGILLESALYATEEEIDEFREYIDNFIENHKKDSCDKNKNNIEYALFTAIIATKK